MFCIYAVALPACIVERIGPLKAMSRSAFLTKGNRWRILGFTLLLFLAPLLSQSVMIVATHTGGCAGILAGRLRARAIEAVGGFSAVAIAVLYAKLRIAREGVDIDHIAAGVFD